MSDEEGVEKRTTLLGELVELAEILQPLFSLSIAVLAVIMERAISSKAGTKQTQSYNPEKHSETKLDDVKGCDEAKAEVLEILQFLKNPDRFERVGAKLPNGILFTGPPGTGKTMIARAIAAEAGVPFFYASASSFEEVFVGVGASRLRGLFAAARKKQPCVIFIDEIDALCPKRSAYSAVHRQTPNQLLELLDGFVKSKIVFIAASNSPETLDSALLRPGRLDKMVHFQPPSLQGRKEILQLYLGKVKLDPSVCVGELARSTIGFTGAELSNIVNTAAIRCATLKQTHVTRDHLEWAHDRVQLGMETGKAMTDREKAITAVHEGGHALVNILTPESSDPLYKATILPRGRALGVTVRLPEHDRMTYTKKHLQGILLIALGGRVAEELAFGSKETTTGAHSDMEHATEVAYSMVTKYGMSTGLGLQVLDYDEISDETKAEADHEVQGLIQTAYRQVQEMLGSHLPHLYGIAEGLLQNEQLLGADMHRIVKDVDADPTKKNTNVNFLDLVDFKPTPTTVEKPSTVPATPEVPEEEDSAWWWKHRWWLAVGGVALLWYSSRQDKLAPFNQRDPVEEPMVSF